MRLRIPPTCSEGFRRISIVVAVLLFALLFIKWNRENMQQISKLRQGCNEESAALMTDCAGSPGCYERASKHNAECQEMITPGYPLGFSGNIFEVWAIFGVGAFFWAYITALTIRIIVRISGWIISGFDPSTGGRR
jgi:hypothetical protein